MRILFAAVGAHGHVYPLLPLATAAARAGHAVAFATGEAMFGTLRTAGIEAYKAGMAPGTAFDRAKRGRPVPVPEDQIPDVVSTVFGDILPRTTFATVKPVIERFGADLVVAEIGNPGAWFAAEYLGVRAMAHTYGRVTSNPLTQLIADRTGKVAADIGVTGSVPYLDICPESLQDPDFMASAQRIVLRPVGWSDPADELPSIALTHTRPLVYVTLSSAEAADAAMLRAVVDGVSSLPVDVLVSSGSTATEIIEPAENVHLRTWVPQSTLMPHVDLLVHHGGAGTMLNAFAAGVPQLVLADPHGAEQGIAETALASGAGDRMAQSDVTASSIRARVDALLASAPARAAAARLSEEIAAMPSPEQVVRILEER